MADWVGPKHSWGGRQCNSSLPWVLKQRAYLRTLAHRTGETFTYLQTIGEASAEIDRLTKRQPSSRIEAHLDRRDVQTALAERPDDADQAPARGDQRLRLELPPWPTRNGKTTMPRRWASAPSWQARQPASNTATG